MSTYKVPKTYYIKDAYSKYSWYCENEMEFRKLAYELTEGYISIKDNLEKIIFLLSDLGFLVSEK